MIIADKYTQLKVVTHRLPGQYEVAKNMLDADLTDRPSTAINAYCKLPSFSAAFSDIISCFHLALTLPVSSATAERSFSAMRRIKAHLRASMSDSRLSSLALIAVELELSRELMRDPSNVINVFATFDSRKNRRLDLLL
jgi:hAT family C-terminal dimerisation region